jgi:hypothetical protein
MTREGSLGDDQASGEEPNPPTTARKSAIVIVRDRKTMQHQQSVPDMMPEEHKRRGDAADALSREMKRRIADARRGALPPPPLKKPG